MIVYLVAAAQALAYLGSVPVCLAFRLQTEGGLRFGLGLGAFDGPAALRRAAKDMAVRKPKKRREKRAPGPRNALGFLSRLRLESLALSGSLRLGDAAATALACGALRALGASLRGRVDRVSVDVAPLFDGGPPRAELRGIIRARSGQIIIAAARSGIDNANRRIAQWTDTRLKAS